MNSGIYEIFSRANGKRYIGSAVNLRDRFRRHRGRLNDRSHHNQHLQNAWLKYGEGEFVFKKLLVCDKKDLLFYEQLALDVYKPEYNVFVTAGSPAGYKHTQEVREQMSAMRTGKKQTQEWRENISKGNIGKIFSNEHCERISKGKKGKKTGPISERRRLAISLAQTERWKRQKETA